MEDKIAVIYKSKYGSTKRYAGWIALKLNADLYEVSDIRNKDLLEYNTIIYGGPIYSSKIKGINFINRNYEKIKDKKIIIFMVGISSQNNSYINNILDNSLCEEIKNNIITFYFRGDFNYNELGIIDKILIKIFKKLNLFKNGYEISQDEGLVLEVINNPINLCNKKSIGDLINKTLGQV